MVRQFKSIIALSRDVRQKSHPISGPPQHLCGVENICVVENKLGWDRPKLSSLNSLH